MVQNNFAEYFWSSSSFPNFCMCLGGFLASLWEWSQQASGNCPSKPLGTVLTSLWEYISSTFLIIILMRLAFTFEPIAALKHCCKELFLLNISYLDVFPCITITDQTMFVCAVSPSGNQCHTTAGTHQHTPSSLLPVTAQPEIYVYLQWQVLFIIYFLYQ